MGLDALLVDGRGDRDDLLELVAERRDGERVLVGRLLALGVEEELSAGGAAQLLLARLGAGGLLCDDPLAVLMALRGDLCLLYTSRCV